MANEKRLIDANDFIKFFEKAKKIAEVIPGELGNILRGLYDEVIEEIKKQPTVDAVEVVHGQWLFDSGRERCFCSVCNETALYTSKDEPIFDYDWEENLRYSHTETYLEEHLTNYCPNCGALMDGRSNVPRMDGDGNG